MYPIHKTWEGSILELYYKSFGLPRDTETTKHDISVPIHFDVKGLKRKDIQRPNLTVFSL